MPVPVVIADLSLVAASNFPLGSDSPSNLDDTQRAHASFIALLRDGNITSLVSTVTVGGITIRGRLIATRVFTAGGVYTPTTGTTAIDVEVQGGGGTGGGLPATTAGQNGAGQGGCAGAYGRSYLTSGFSGVTMVIGAAGAASGAAAGGSGGVTSFGGAIVSAPGGTGGGGGAGFVVGGYPVIVPPLANTASATGGNVFNRSGQGGGGLLFIALDKSQSGAGGSSLFGTGGQANAGTIASGSVADGYGAGGGGAILNQSSGTNANGGLGTQGVIIVREYA